MTVGNNIAKSGPYVGIGTVDPFTVGFYFLQNADLLITRLNADGSETNMAIPADFTATGAGNPAGGAITPTSTSTAPAGCKITITRNISILQPQAYPATGVLPSAALEQGLDRLTMICQQVAGYLGRAILLKVSSVLTSLTIADPLPNNLVGWNATGTGLENKGVATNALAVTTFFAAGQTQPDVVPVAVGTDALAVGNAASVNGTRAIAFGNAYASGQDSVCMQNGGNTNTAGAQGLAAAIFGGLLNYITSTATYAAIVGGSGNLISTSGDNCAIVGGATGVISGSSIKSSISGGNINTIKNASSYCHIGGGNNNSIDGSNSCGIIASQQTSIGSGSFACAFLASAGSSTIGTSCAEVAIIGSTSATAANGVVQAAIIGGASNTLDTSANQSVIIGGITNYINAARAAIVGGGSNSVQGSATYSAILGGSGNGINAAAFSGIVGGSGCNILSVSAAAIVGGSGNTIAGSQGAILGGNSNFIASTANAAVATGIAANAVMQAQNVHSSGSFSTGGDAQTSEYIERIITTNNTQTEAFLDGTAKRMIIPSNTAWAFVVDIVAKRTDAQGEDAFYTCKGIIRNNAGTVSLPAAITNTVNYRTNAGWVVDVQADNTNKALVVKVTGENAKTVRWVAKVMTVEVTG